MSETSPLSRVTGAAARLDHAFQLGQSVDQPGIITSAPTATWHIAGMIEHLRSLREEQVERLKLNQWSASLVCPDEEETV